MTLTAALRRHATAQGERPALSFVSYDRDPQGVTTTWTYTDVDVRARALAVTLQRHCARGERVAIVCPQSLHYATAFLGCLYAGRVAVPLHAPGRYNRRLARLLADVAPGCVLTTSATLPALERFQTTEASAPDRTVCVDAVDLALAAAWRPPAPRGDDVAYLQYTSGSTAEPRGVMVTHANIAHTVMQCDAAYDLASATASASWLPFFHDLGLAVAITVPLFLGRHAVTMTPFAFVQRPARWLRLIDRHRASFTAAPGSALELCVDRVGTDEVRDVDLSCLHVLLTGAEPVRAHALDRFTGAFARHGFRHAMHAPSYGLAEATVLVTAVGPTEEPAVLACDRAALADGTVRRVSDDAGSSGARQLVSVGVPAGQRVAIVDPDTHRALGEDRVGEVWVHGPNVAAGYHQRPEATRAAFHARLRSGDETNDHVGWLRTGDLGFLHAGALYVAGRRKELIVIDGRNHHPIDIEATVEAADARVLPGRVAAFGVDDGAEHLVVVVEIERRDVANDDWDEAGLRRAIRAAVAEHHGINVKDLLLVRKGSLARTSSGKLARDACRLRYLEQGYAPLAGRPAAMTGTSEPAGADQPAGAEPRAWQRGHPHTMATRAPSGGDRHEIEDWLVRRVADRLGVPVDDVDPHRALADYGFSSADAVAFTSDATPSASRRRCSGSTRASVRCRSTWLPRCRRC